jgi:hypothetical protein
MEAHPAKFPSFEQNVSSPVVALEWQETPLVTEEGDNDCVT